MKRALRTVLIVGGIIALLTGALVMLFLTQQPLDELVGLSSSAFDDDARDSAPESASRILYYTTGFTDSATWIAYTADKDAVIREVESRCGKPISELEDWDPQRRGSFTRPARAERWNKGYWDIDETKVGKRYSRFEDGHGIEVLVDLERWRAFIHVYST